MRLITSLAVALIVSSAGIALAAPSPGRSISPELQMAADICYGKGTSDWVSLAKSCTTVLDVPTLPKGRRAAALFNRGTAALHLGGPKTAYEDFTEALKIEPKFTRALEARGAILVGQQKFDLAIVDLNQAIALDPKSSDAYSNRGMAYVGKKDGVKALADFEKAVALAPLDASAYAARGTAYVLLKQSDKALADFNKAIGLDSKLTVAFFNRGSLYAAGGDKARAKADFEQVLAIQPTDERAKQALKNLESKG